MQHQLAWDPSILPGALSSASLQLSFHLEGGMRGEEGRGKQRGPESMLQRGVIGSDDRLTPVVQPKTSGIANSLPFYSMRFAYGLQQR